MYATDRCDAKEYTCYSCPDYDRCLAEAEGLSMTVEIERINGYYAAYRVPGNPNYPSKKYAVEVSNDKNRLINILIDRGYQIAEAVTAQ